MKNKYLIISLIIILAIGFYWNQKTDKREKVSREEIYKEEQSKEPEEFPQSVVIDSETGEEYGNFENFEGVVKDKKDGIIEISYTTDDDFTIGFVENFSDCNIDYDSIKIGDYIRATGKVSNIDLSGKKTINAGLVSVFSEKEYKEKLLTEVEGKLEFSSIIEDYYQAESGYDGYVICGFYLGEHEPIQMGYLKIYYDFYEDNTESYLGRKERPLHSDYGIVKYEIVDITLKEPITSLDKTPEAKCFEYIAD